MKFYKFIFTSLLLVSNLLAQSTASKISNNLQSKISQIADTEKVLVWIYLGDKGESTSEYINYPNKVVSERSLKRRAKVRIKENLLDFSDFPINENYTKKLNSFGIKIKQKSKWLNAVSCYLTKSQLYQAQNYLSVQKITEVKTFIREKIIQPVETSILQKGNTSTNITAHTYNYGSSLTQNEVMKIVDVHDQGYTGAGVMICLMDAGFDRLSTHEVFNSLSIIATWDFVNNDADVEDSTDLGEGSHGTGTLSLIGGFKEGKLIGTAFGADYILAKTENTVTETKIEEDNWVAAAEWADSIGADIFSTSLGYLTFDSGPSYDYTDMDGNTTIITKAADLAVGKGIAVFNSAGNNNYNPDHNTLNAPADGDSVIAIGAVNGSKIRADFSSVGPTYDGRIKPDLMAMGSGTYAAGNNSDISYRSGFNGTSASCPIAAGIAALVLEKDSSLTPMSIRDILKNTADNTSSPNNLYGWGVIDALAAMNSIPSVAVQLKINLEGSYDSLSHEMISYLSGTIPLTSPYSENIRTVKSIPNNIVDWVLVELRETLNESAILSHSAFLHKDGRIVSDDGINSTIRLKSDAGFYYIVIKHRNHLSVITPNPVFLDIN